MKEKFIQMNNVHNPKRGEIFTLDFCSLSDEIQTTFSTLLCPVSSKLVTFVVRERKTVFEEIQ